MKELVNAIGYGPLRSRRHVLWNKADLLRADWRISRFILHFDRPEISSGVQGRNQLPSRLPTGAYMNDATAMLAAIRSGDADATERLLVLVYDELRRLAAAKLAGEAAGQTLQATALVHEAWLRLVGDHSRSFKDREHFFRASAEAMRRILIDRARRKHTQRHGGAYHRVELEDFDPAAPTADDQLLAVNEALDQLALEHPEHAELVKLKYFAGLTNEEVGEVLGISLSTVKNYWAFSRAWLLNEISR
jgi:RNA polymerase sigma factor (TIGR02999 family)